MGKCFKREGESRYTIRWTDELGRARSRRAFARKNVSLQLLTKLEREVEERMAGLRPREDCRTLAELRSDFLDSLAAKGVTDRYRVQTTTRLDAVLNAIKVGHVSELTQSPVDRFLAKIVKEGKSAKTRDGYAAAVKQFGNWLEDEGVVLRNPFKRTALIAGEHNKKFNRQALGFKELGDLAAAAEVRSRDAYAASHPRAKPETLDRYAEFGRNRAVLYWAAAFTGLRRGELKALAWGDLDLEARVLTVQAPTTKNRKRLLIPLVPWLADLLITWRKHQAVRGSRTPRQSGKVFHVGNNLLEQMRKDAEWAKLPLVDDLGRKLDFHALRTTAQSLMAAHGVPLQIAQRMMRHSDPRTTDKNYTRLEVAQIAGWLERLPALAPDLAPRLLTSGGLARPAMDGDGQPQADISCGGKNA